MDQNGIRNLAKKTAKNVRKPFDTIKVPYQDDIQFEVSRKKEVTKGFWIFKTTHSENVTDVKTGTKVKYNDVPIDGWILYIFYENCDEVAPSCKYREIFKRFYVLKSNGDLCVYEIGFEISSVGTNYEKLDLFRSLKENEMTFTTPGRWNDGTPRLLDLVEKYSAFALDYKPIKWENRHSSGGETKYFKRNIPYKVGDNHVEGQSFTVHQPGGGLVTALNKLASNS